MMPLLLALVLTVLVAVGAGAGLRAVLETAAPPADHDRRALATSLSALDRYALTHRAGHLPCPADAALGRSDANAGVAAAGTPAGGCADNVTHGVLPWRTLALPRTAMVDAHGHLPAYARAPVFDCTAGTTPAQIVPTPLRLRDHRGATVVTREAAWVVWLAGADGDGALRAEGGRTPLPADAAPGEHANLDPATPFETHPPGQHGFDDQLRWLSPAEAVAAYCAGPPEAPLQPFAYPPALGADWAAFLVRTQGTRRLPVVVPPEHLRPLPDPPGTGTDRPDPRALDISEETPGPPQGPDAPDPGATCLWWPEPLPVGGGDLHAWLTFSLTRPADAVTHNQWGFTLAVAEAPTDQAPGCGETGQGLGYGTADAAPPAMVAGAGVAPPTPATLTLSLLGPTLTLPRVMVPLDPTMLFQGHAQPHTLRLLLQPAACGVGRPGLAAWLLPHGAQPPAHWETVTAPLTVPDAATCLDHPVPARGWLGITVGHGGPGGGDPWFHRLRFQITPP